MTASDTPNEWATDSPASVETALEMLRFGQISPDWKDGQDRSYQRTEQRMLNCADVLERALAAKEKECEELRHDIARAVQTNAELATELAEARQEINERQWGALIGALHTVRGFLNLPGVLSCTPEYAARKMEVLESVHIAIDAARANPPKESGHD